MKTEAIKQLNPSQAMKKYTLDVCNIVFIITKECWESQGT